MKRHKFRTTVLVCMICYALTACSNQTENKTQTYNTTSNSSSIVTKQLISTPTDSLALQKNKLTKIYTQAIAEFIKVAYKKDKTTFDTLYFGKHVYGQPDDFPNIELQETIEQTHIKLVTPEVGQKKQQARKSLVYVNMMGWVDKVKAEFVLVIFSNGIEHQYDYFINFSFNSKKQEFELEKIEFENYLSSKGQKTKRITIYKDGKYLENK